MSIEAPLREALIDLIGDVRRREASCVDLAKEWENDTYYKGRVFGKALAYAHCVALIEYVLDRHDRATLL